MSPGRIVVCVCFCLSLCIVYFSNWLMWDSFVGFSLIFIATGVLWSCLETNQVHDHVEQCYLEIVNLKAIYLKQEKLDILEMYNLQDLPPPIIENVQSINEHYQGME